MIEIIDIMSKVQELKLDAWKGGYLCGTGRRDAAWKIRPVLQGTIDDIRKMLIEYREKMPCVEPHKR